MPQDAALTLKSPLTDLPGVGPASFNKLRRLGLETVADLIRHLPMRYAFESAEGTIDTLVEGSVGATRGIVAARRVSGFGKRSRLEATLQDDTGTLRMVWFNAGYWLDRIHPGVAARVQGKVKFNLGYPEMTNPVVSIMSEDEIETRVATDDKLRPVYPATDGMASGKIEQLVAAALPKVVDQLPDPLPEKLRKANNMPALPEAFTMLHQPQDEDETKQGTRRLAYNELLLLQLGVAIKRAHIEHRVVAPPLKHSEAIDSQIRQAFPFDLTDAQERVVQEIAADLQKSRPMNRLVQGDVGAGKTVVALYAMLMAAMSGKQAALMAPTELLAEQHHKSISKMLAGSSICVALLTGNSEDRKQVTADIEAGRIDLIVGTHALLYGVPFKDLAVAVIDEQHRFGVEQRAQLRTAKDEDDDDGKEHSPHVLIMTATPIPRTLSLTVFGDLDISTIDALPPGRTPITTRVVPPEKAPTVYDYARQRVDQGEQVYVVVPSIDGAQVAGDKTLKAVEDHAKALQQTHFQGAKVGFVHGRLKSAEREAVMSAFRAGEIDVLVATTVIEVGVDVPNATIMIIEHAERFGLAQLHQLRGRIGRGASQNKPVCALIADPTTDDASKRLEAIASTTDGFKIAELDLEIRGMGEFFGTKQAGMSTFRVAKLPKHMDLVRLARRDAEALVQEDPGLSHEDHKLLKKVLWQQYGESLGLIDVG